MKTKNQIRFILDGKVTVIDFGDGCPYKPTTTVLNYLRSLPGHKGVKEGCAEGDCGACTIVVAEPGPDGTLLYQALDSCLVFLPMLHGKQLITVENLAQRDNGALKLHPVQQAMVDLGGSQCGYCTPGIVMSLFALSKSTREVKRETAIDALTGNLCRCTGYQPILDAALQTCADKAEDRFSKDEHAIVQQLREIKAEIKSPHLKTADREYFRPAGFSEALKILAKNPDAIITNGATDIALRQTKKFEQLHKILDLSGIQELRFFRTKNGEYHIGAGLTMEELKNHSEKRLPELAGMLAVFASLQIRNIATIGGNIGSASPISDTIPLLFAYKARIVAGGPGSKREIAVEDFITGYRKTCLQAGELIHSLIIPKPPKTAAIRAFKVSKRKDLDIATVSAAFRMELHDDTTVKEAILAYGGMAECTKRARQAEDFLTGRPFTRNTVEAAADILRREFTPLSDARSGKEFRNIAAANLLMKCYLSLQ